MGYVLIGTEASYFTGKARAYLRWKGVEFENLTATPAVYRDIVEPRVGFAVIPVLLTPDNKTVQDTADIIEFVEGSGPGPSVYPPGPVQQLISLLIQLYADEWLVIPAMHYRWSYNEQWIAGEFGRVAAPDASPDEQQRVGLIIGERFRSFAPRLGVSEDTIAGIEAHYEGFLADFSAHLRCMPFLLGSRPSLGDFALFGPLYAHLYRDPASGDLMKRLAPLVSDWVERLRDAASQAGTFAPDDETPTTLLPILKRQMREQLPVLMDSAAKLRDWAAVQPRGARVPRSLGEHEFSIGGRSGGRSVVTFSLWRLQQALDHYNTLKVEDRRRANRLLGDIGGEALATLAAPRLNRRDFRLVLD